MKTPEAERFLAFSFVDADRAPNFMPGGLRQQGYELYRRAKKAVPQRRAPCS